MKSHIVEVILVLLTVVWPGRIVDTKIVTCYKCKDCGDPFDAKTMSAVKVNCTGSCMKEVSKITAVEDNLPPDRGCHDKPTSRDICEEVEKGITSTLLCLCTTDLCNSGRTLTPDRVVVATITYVVMTLGAL